MEEKKLVPKKRFKNCSEKWYVNKLKDIATFSKGKGYSKKDITKKGTELLLYGSLYTSYKTIINGVKTYVIPKENSVISTGKEVVVPSSGETKEDIARASAINKPGIIIGGDLNIIQPRKELNTVFLSLEISNGSSQKELIKRAQGSSVVHLYNDDLKEVLIFYPDSKEQQKIGEFFKVLDERIANQERKIAKVKALKEAYLTEMFPQDHEAVPKRRFKGVEGEWEQLLLEDVILTEVKGQVNANMLGGNTPYLETEYLNGGRKSYVSANKNVEEEDVLILWDGSNAGTVYHGFEGGLGSTLKVYKPKYVGSFLYYYLKRHQNNIYTNYRTPNIPHVINTFTHEFQVELPNIEEQQKIGAFFKNLDDQIRAEETKLEKLKKMKEAYLEEMFV